jgi:VWFA-related protein
MMRFIGCAAFGVCLAFSLPAQETPPPAASGQTASPLQNPPITLIPRSHEQREQSYRAEHRIVLNVMVTDAHGKPARGLAREDFVLTDDRQPRTIASFRAANGRSARERVHILLVLDSVNNSGKTIGFERKEIEKYLAENRGRIEYPISLAMLSGSGATVNPPSRDADDLLGELRQLTHDVHGIDCVDEANGPTSQFDLSLTRSDALAPLDLIPAQAREAECLNRRFLISISALNTLARAQIDVPGRAIVIWLGAGWPLLTNPTFRADTSSMKRRFFDYLVDLSLNLQQAQVTMDAVVSPDILRSAGLLLDDYHKASLIGVPTTDQASPANMSLPILAWQSGGQILDSKDLAGEIAASIADAESYYVLSFDAAPVAGAVEYHPLEVKVSKPGLTVRTNAAYFVQP